MASMPANSSVKPSSTTTNGEPRRSRNHNTTRNHGPHGGGGGNANSVQQAAGKRGGQRMNHLLSFTLPPRSRPPPPAARRSRRAGGGAPFNKERYINAQYRFLVKPAGDYTAYFADSDIYLNWADILQVLIPTTSALSGASAAAAAAAAAAAHPLFLDQPPSTSSGSSSHEHEGAACPICLSPPTAPRMTKCGHVFCYPCILHYLTLSPDGAGGGSSTLGAGAGNSHGGTALSHKWRRCPICWDAVYARDLKAVKWWNPRAVASQHQAEVEQERQRVEALHRSRHEHERHHEQQAGVRGDTNCSTAAVASADAEGYASSSFDAAASGHGAGSSGASRGSDEVLALRLVERPHLTTLALPRSPTWPSSSLDHPLIPLHSAPWHFQPDVMGFAKFMLASPDLLIESLTGDLVHLEQELETLKGFGADEASLKFVRLAERKVREQIENVQTELDTAFVRSTIGQIKNDLKDHEAVESGRISRLDEQISRRQRKRLERRQTADEGEGEGDEARLGGASSEPGDDVATAAGLNDAGKGGLVDDGVDEGAPERAHGTEEFLALRSQAHGGNHPAVATTAAVGSQAAAPFEGQAAAATTTMTSAATTIGGNGQRAGGAAPRGQHHRRNVNPPPPSSSSYLFFQAASGQNIFLHPLDIKIVLSHYGSYAALPRDLSVKVQGADEGSMNDELRRRCRYLSHIPMATDVVFIEVDWEGMDLVDRSTLRSYEQALRQRKTKRRDKQRREDRAKIKAEEGGTGGSRIGGGSGGSGGGTLMQRYGRSEAGDGGGGGGGGFDSEINFPSDGLSWSYGSSSLASGHEGEGAGDGAALSGGSASPSFREAALWGAERDFPMHPGTSAIENFPDSLGALSSQGGVAQQGQQGSGGRTIASNGSGGGEGGSGAKKKTVWGTPAARDAFDRAPRGKGGGGGQEEWDEEIEDAWHELEEDFILGSTGSGRRPNGSVKEGRGLNRQMSHGFTGGGGAKKAGGTTGSGNGTPKGRASWGSAAKAEEEKDAEGTTSGAQTPSSTAGAAADAGGGWKKKKRNNNNKKLVLTGGGGRRAW